MNIDFLGAHPEFLPELSVLHFDEWRHISPEKTLEDRVSKMQRMAASSDLPFMVVAFETDQLIGSAALVCEDMRSRKDLSPWLASVYVKPEFRGKGVATALVRHIEAAASQRGIETLYLFTEHARDLYARLGWCDLQACEYQGVNVMVMSRRLEAD